MPEGPEAKLLVKFLDHFFKDNKIMDIDIIGGRYKKHGKPYLFYSFSRNLPTKVLKVDNKGKLIYFIFSNGHIMWNTLGMSGFWTINEKLEHNDIRFETENGNVYFNDMRHFGTITFVKSKIELQQKLDTLGPDIMSDTIIFEKFNENLRKYPEKKISIILMDQQIVSGIGNYLVNEILYAAKISPHRKVKNINDSEMNKIFKYAQKISQKMINLSSEEMNNLLNGHTKFITNYKKRPFKVYRQEKDPLGNSIKHENIGGRTKHWVSSIQT